VNDYLVNEVLEQLGEDFSDFMTEISVLDHLTRRYARQSARIRCR